MRKGTQKRYSKRTRGKSVSVLRIAASMILTTVIVISAAAVVLANNESAAEAVPATETYTPYYMTEEYRQAKLAEQEEAEALRQSIEEYQLRQEQEAEEAFKAMQEEYEEPEEPYPFNTMSKDWGADDIEGFTYYEIPREYADYSGYFPEIMQIYLYTICKDKGIDYPTAVAMIEQESAYQYDLVGSSSDTGYYQVIPKWHVDRMKKLGATDMLNPYQNATVAMDYLAELLDKYDGNYSKALTAYNCGPAGAYNNYFSAGVEANDYAKSVLKKAKRIRKELSNG